MSVVFMGCTLTVPEEAHVWTWTTKGFTSVVAYDPRKDSDPASPFPSIAKSGGTHLLIRARVPEHLEALRVVVPDLVTHDDESADYRYRTVITRSKFKEYLSCQVDGLDYDSHFKEAMEADQPEHLAGPMYSAAMSVWATMAKLQPTPPYSGARGSRSN